MLKSNKTKNEFCNEKNFSSFFSKQSNLLFNYIYYKCGNTDLANDIVQEAFIKIWKNCAKVIPNKAKAFLFTIANNLFLNEYTRSTVIIDYKNTIKKDYTNETPEFILEEKEFEDKLQNAISNLTEAQRVAFLLHRVDGKKYKEIANLLGISIKAVEKRIHNALLNLRKSIDEI